MIYATVNQKGGVGKTTTTEALLGGLSLRGFKVLAVDLDSQCNLTYTTAADTDGPTALDVLTGAADIREAIRHTESGDVLPACPSLAGADAFIKETGKEYRLREALGAVQSAYDYIVIDTPPALGILTVNALTACDAVIIPAQADIYSLQGIHQLAETMQPVKKYCNPSLRVAGILLTRYNSRAVLSRDVQDLARGMAGDLGTRVFDTTIREAVAIKEAQISREPLFSYAPGAKVTGDYKAFIEELLTMEGAGKNG